MSISGGWSPGGLQKQRTWISEVYGFFTNECLKNDMKPGWFLLSAIVFTQIAAYVVAGGVYLFFSEFTAWKPNSVIPPLVLIAVGLRVLYKYIAWLSPK